MVIATAEMKASFQSYYAALLQAGDQREGTKSTNLNVNNLFRHLQWLYKFEILSKVFKSFERIFTNFQVKLSNFGR